ncbi:pre-toxin TG domain-containing protein [Bacillus cereus]
MFTVLTEFDKIADELERAGEKFRKADEEEQKAMENRINAKMWTDIAGELSGGYDAARAIDGIDPSTGEKVGWFDRSVAGVMVVGNMIQVGKLGKYLKLQKP